MRLLPNCRLQEQKCSAVIVMAITYSALTLSLDYETKLVHNMIPGVLQTMGDHNITLAHAKNTTKRVMPVYASKGINNYKMEFRNAVILARQLGRCICTPPFVDGKTIAGQLDMTVAVSEVYDLDLLSHFVPICAACAHTVLNKSVGDATISCEQLLPMRRGLAPVADPKQLAQYRNMDANTIFFEYCLWLSADAQHLRTPEIIRELWRVLRKPSQTSELANRAISQLGTNFVSFHWRFEETKCSGQYEDQLLCFRVSRPTRESTFTCVCRSGCTRNTPDIEW